MLLLGFGSKARQGKDSAANAIKDYYDSQRTLVVKHGLGLSTHGVRVGIFKFATALYQEVNEAIKDGIWENRRVQTGTIESENGELVVPTYTDIPSWVQPEPNAEISPLAPYGKHPKLLQWWGTEYRRAQDPDYWVKKTMSSIPVNLDIAMITDVRFPNEVEAVKQRGGYNVQVQRLRTDGTPFYSSDRSVDHPSETALDGYDWDFYIKTKEPHVALVGEQAITLCEYLRGLEKK